MFLGRKLSALLGQIIQLRHYLQLLRSNLFAVLHQFRAFSAQLPGMLAAGHIGRRMQHVVITHCAHECIQFLTDLAHAVRQLIAEHFKPVTLCQQLVVLLVNFLARDHAPY